MSPKLKKLLGSKDPFVAMFIREAAIEKAKACLESGLPEWPERCVISRKLWLRIAAEIIEATS